MNNNEYIAFSCYEKVSRSLSYERHKGNIEKEIIHNDFVFPESKVSILIALKDYYLEKCVKTLYIFYSYELHPPSIQRSLRE